MAMHKSKIAYLDVILPKIGILKRQEIRRFDED